jgi:hypothetical protein
MFYLCKPHVWFSSVHLMKYIAALNDKLYTLKSLEPTSWVSSLNVTFVLLPDTFWSVAQVMQPDARFCLLLTISEWVCEDLTALTPVVAFFMSH